MRATKFIFTIIYLSLTSNIFAQSQSTFDNGFRDGFNETLKEEGINGNYLSYGNSKDCYSEFSSKQNSSYSEGYRCGVKEATKAMPKIKNHASSTRQNTRNSNTTTQRIAQQQSRVIEANNRQNQYLRKKQIENQSLNNRTVNQSSSYNPKVLYELKQRQVKSQNYYNQQVNNTLNSLSRSMQAVAYANIEKELKRRKKAANEFVSWNSSRIDKVNEMYAQIPQENFNRNVTGYFSANMFIERKYSFVNNQKLISETPCLVVVENGVLKELYAHGKKGFKLDYPKDNPSASVFLNGIVKYNDYLTMETVTVVLVEPYLSNNPKEYGLNPEGTGYVVLWTSKKSDMDKIIYVQELNKNGNIVRELPVPLVYAKNEKDLKTISYESIPVNTKNKILYFGEPTKTPYGTFPLYPKTAKSNNEPLTNDEVRYIEIKKYRE